MTRNILSVIIDDLEDQLSQAEETRQHGFLPEYREYGRGKSEGLTIAINALKGSL